MTYRFDPVDIEQLKLSAHLSPGRRWQRLLDARELAVGLIRGRLHRLMAAPAHLREDGCGGIGNSTRITRMARMSTDKINIGVNPQNPFDPCPIYTRDVL